MFQKALDGVMGDFNGFVLAAGDVCGGGNGLGEDDITTLVEESSCGSSWGSTLPPTTQALGAAVHQLQTAMQVMNQQMRKTGEMVRLVAMGLNVQKERMNMLRKKVNDVEDKLEYCVMQEKSEMADESEATEIWLDESTKVDVSVQAFFVSDDSADERVVSELSNEEGTVDVSVQVSCVSEKNEASTSTDWNHLRILTPFGFPTLSLSSPTSTTTLSPSSELPSQETQTLVRSVSCTACVPNVPARRERLGRKLLRATLDGNTSAVKKLLKEGANVNYQNSSKWTPLLIAAMKAHPDIVALLLDRGAKVNAKNAFGYTALHMAAYNDPTGLCARFLIYEGCNVGVKNQFGRTPLHYAAESENESVVRALLRAGAKMSAKDDKGNTPYDLAKNLYVRQLLTPAGASKYDG